MFIKMLFCLQTTQCYNAEDFTFRSYCYENLQSKLIYHFVRENGIILEAIKRSLKIAKGC
jgi:hypothetical protein